MAHQPTVFVVDDDSGVRRSLRALGRSHGLTVETYASAQAFLAAYDPDPNFMLHWDKAKVNAEDIPKDKEKKSPTKKRPATKKPSR